MKRQSFSVRIAARRHGVRGRLVLLVTAAALVMSNVGAAQMEAPGEQVLIPGTDIPGWGHVDTVPGRFGRPAGAPPKGPAVPQRVAVSVSLAVRSCSWTAGSVGFALSAHQRARPGAECRPPRGERRSPPSRAPLAMPE